jgi:cytochrome oxidase Cu insertion factor (SCO1/SenC/PrrC family)
MSGRRGVESAGLSAWARSLGAVCAFLLAGAGFPACAQEPAPAAAARLMDDLMWGRGPVGGPFELTDHNGRKRTDADFRGKFLIVYFGYTTCPDICPTDLLEISRAVEALGAAGGDVQPLFISVDPERDSAAVLAQYVAPFHPRLIGLTGTPEQIRAVAHAYKAYYAKYSPPGGGVYLIDHTGIIYLMDRAGRYLGFFPPGTSADRMIEIIRPQLAAR